SRLYLIDPCRTELAFQSHELALLRDRHLHVRLRENCDHIARFQSKVLCVVALNGLAQIKRQQMEREILRVHALDDRVFPVNLSDRTLDLVFKFLLLEPLRFDSAHSLVRISIIVSTGGGSMRAAITILGWPQFFRKLKALARRTPGQQVLALPVLIRDKKIPVWNQLVHAHAFTLRIAPGQRYIPAQGNRVVELGRDMQKTDHIAILQFTSQPVIGKREFIGFALMARINALQDGALARSRGG